MIIEYIAATPWFSISITLIFSLCVGSFLNVVIYRLPVMMEREWEEQIAELNESTEATPTDKFNLSVPASACPNCQHKIRWYENIPVLSYLFLKGACSSCKIKISLRYPFIELTTGLLSACIVYQFGFNLVSLSLVFLTWCLICLTMIDVDHQLLPDKITLPLIWLGLIVNSFDYFTSLPQALWGAVLGYLSLWSIYWLFKLLTGKEGMGYGDFKLLAALGAWAGASMLPLIILLSSLVGAVLGITMILLRRHEAQNPIPFGPYLACAGWIAMLWGSEITGFYLHFLQV
ncbi:prepilin peptidase [Aliamphritea hakodatensis]|uniref:prepilin peptidase n=1 Tax=Aliamphritea hakodatensis TaxID=2895352 RepID=UPI0022FD9D1E|nr:A24 family peptidase [Aliamphritea hakodatensis]